ncbi:MAG: hypothetical protein ABSA16_15515 [Thermoguttaceae bacterium]
MKPERALLFLKNTKKIRCQNPRLLYPASALPMPDGRAMQTNDFVEVLIGDV